MLLMLICLMLACSYGLEGISIGDEQEPVNPIAEMFYQETLDAMNAEEAALAPSEATQPADYQPVAPSGSGPQQSSAGAHEYAVSAEDFTCVCQVAGNVTTNFNFKENQLEILNASGGAEVYDKIAENTYKRSFMGSYILQSGSGAEVTSTVVEEEKHVIIILTDDGYVMEHYSGEENSPCCFHTFTIQK